MEASTDYFLSVIECNRIIYDKSSKDFKNAAKKDEAWARIARNSKMTVEAAKKRYTSLRQKYCRENNKMEIQRRTKSNPVRPWIFHERMQFLDEFIQPRLTYTNDTGFNDTGDVGAGVGAAVGALAEDDATYHEFDERDTGNVETNRGSDEGIVTYNPEDVQDRNSLQFIDTSENDNEIILSEYSGEITTFHAGVDSTCTPRDAAANSTSVAEDEVQYVHEEPMTTTTSTYAARVQLLPTQTSRNLSSSSRNAPNSDTGNSNNSQPSTQKGGSTLRKSAHTKSAQNATSSSCTRMPQPSLPSSDPSMEAMKQKLGSCISSLSTKISEKHDRSPHAPFLAYLGTKLSNVPKEGLATLEKQILELVESFIQ